MKISLRDFLMKFQGLGGDVTRLSYYVKSYDIRRSIAEATPENLLSRRRDGSTFYTNEDFYYQPRHLTVEPLRIHKVTVNPRVTLRVFPN